MKNKNFLKIVLFFIILINLNVINLGVMAQEAVPYNPNEKVSESLGEIDSSTGLPKKFSEFKEKADELRYSEQNKNYLLKEWSKILANNKFFGPVLFYTDKFFSIFNPFWKAIFGMEFSWSWAFFVGLGLWLMIIIVIYFPAKAMFENKLFALITGFVVASITGFSGIISTAVLFFAPFIKNIWILIIAISFAVLLAYLYQKLFKSFEEESEEEKLKRSKESIKTYGRAIEKGLKEI